MQAVDLVLRGGRVIDPANSIDGINDVAIGGGKIVQVAPNILAPGASTIDVRDKLVLPGMIDTHA